MNVINYLIKIAEGQADLLREDDEWLKETIRVLKTKPDWDVLSEIDAGLSEIENAIYNKLNNSEMLFLIKQAAAAYSQGRDGDCVKIIRMMAERCPQSAEIQAALASAYSDAGYTGNAVKTWKKLYESDMDNSLYSFELAEAYFERGWHRKALYQYNRTKFLDPDNAAAWEGMIYCYFEAHEDDIAEQTCYEAISTLEERGIKSAELYILAFELSCEGFNIGDAAEQYLKSAVEIIKEDDKLSKGKFNGIFGRLLVIIKNNYAYEMLPYLRELAGNNRELSQSLMNIFHNLETEADFEVLEDDYPELLHSLLFQLMEDNDDDERSDDVTAMECSILADFEGYRPHLISLSEQYPRLYALHSEFFNTVMVSVNREEMLQHRLKLLSDKQLRPNLLRADGKEIRGIHHPDTYRREGPKIGRNAPCPCGSGKKYKKCCIA